MNRRHKVFAHKISSEVFTSDRASTRPSTAHAPTQHPPIHESSGTTYTVTFAFLRWQFMVASTPTTVPCITVPFFSSIVTCSRFSFCRNLTSFIVCECLVVLSFDRRLCNAGAVLVLYAYIYLNVPWSRVAAARCRTVSCGRRAGRSESTLSTICYLLMPHGI